MTKTEEEVSKLYEAGFSLVEVAAMRGVSRQTIKDQRHRSGRTAPRAFCSRSSDIVRRMVQLRNDCMTQGLSFRALDQLARNEWRKENAK